MKKFLSVLLSTLFLISNIPCANADGIITSDCQENVMPSTMTACLTGDQGNTEYVIGHLINVESGNVVSHNQPNVTNEDSDISATYLFNVYSNGETMSAQTLSTTITESGIDPGYCSEVYLTIKCNHTGDIPDEYLLKNVSGYWRISDPKASVKSAKLQYSCRNLAISGSVNQVVYNKSVSNNFSVNTGFSVYVPKGEFGSMIGASLNLTYLMGTARTWTFTLQNLLDN